MRLAESRPVRSQSRGWTTQLRAVETSSYARTGTGPFCACGGKKTVKRIVVPVTALACVYCLNLRGMCVRVWEGHERSIIHLAGDQLHSDHSINHQSSVTYQPPEAFHLFRSVSAVESAAAMAQLFVWT